MKVLNLNVRRETDVTVRLLVMTRSRGREGVVMKKGMKMVASRNNRMSV